MIHRVLLNHLKAKFVAVAKGLTEFETEFMAHLVIMDKNGKSRTMGDALLPEYRRSVEEGKGGDFKLLTDDKDNPKNDKKGTVKTRFRTRKEIMEGEEEKPEGV